MAFAVQKELECTTCLAQQINAEEEKPLHKMIPTTQKAKSADLCCFNNPAKSHLHLPYEPIRYISYMEAFCISTNVTNTL